MKMLWGITAGLLLVGAARADVGDLIKQMKDPDADMRRAAVRQLSEVGPSEVSKAVPVLVAALKDKDVFVRRFSAQALAKLEVKDGAAIAGLAAMLKDPKEEKEAAEAAVTALGKMGSEAVSALSDVVKNGRQDNIVRRKAAEALGSIGPAANSAVPALVDALNGKLAMKPGKGPPDNPGADIRPEIATALGEIATSKDSAAIQGLEALTDKKNRNRALKQAAEKALQKIKSRT